MSCTDLLEVRVKAVQASLLTPGAQFPRPATGPRPPPIRPFGRWNAGRPDHQPQTIPMRSGVCRRPHDWDALSPHVR
jgi:hypothetical protein